MAKGTAIRSQSIRLRFELIGIAPHWSGRRPLRDQLNLPRSVFGERHGNDMHSAAGPRSGTRKTTNAGSVVLSHGDDCLSDLEWRLTDHSAGLRPIEGRLEVCRLKRFAMEPSSSNNCNRDANPESAHGTLAGRAGGSGGGRPKELLYIKFRGVQPIFVDDARANARGLLRDLEREQDGSVPGVTIGLVRVLDSTPEIAEQMDILVEVIAPTSADTG